MNHDISYILSIATRRRFADTFWKELARRREANPKTTRRDVFESLESDYEHIFGEEMWNYNTFRHSNEFNER